MNLTYQKATVTKGASRASKANVGKTVESKGVPVVSQGRESVGVKGSVGLTEIGKLRLELPSSRGISSKDAKIGMSDLKLYTRNSIIREKSVGDVVYVSNGKDWNRVTIGKGHIGERFGALAGTKKVAKYKKGATGKKK